MRDPLLGADPRHLNAAIAGGVTAPARVVIVGAGISGLATAYFLEQLAADGRRAVECTVVDRAPRAGGKILTERESGFVLEAGPDSVFSAKPAAIELCRELGLADAVLPAAANGRTLVVRASRLVPLPEGFESLVPTRLAPFATSRLFSPAGKLRLALEPLVRPRAGSEDESIAAFVTRRLGRQALERMAAPLLCGIHSSDPSRQSLLATFPALRAAEIEHGSLLAAARARRRALRAQPPAPSPFATLCGGMGDLVAALRTRLRSTRLVVDVAATRIDREVFEEPPPCPGAARGACRSSPYRVALAGRASIPADAVVLAVPARAAADLLAKVAPALAGRLGELRAVSTATVSLGFREPDVAHPMRGYGFVVPPAERRAISACTWTSSKFAHRAPAGTRLLRVFIGGAAREAIALASDEELIAIARRELSELMGIRAAPIVARAYRSLDGQPQYDVGHLDRVREIDELAAGASGLFLAGSALHGVGLPDCIADARRCAAEVADLLDAQRASAVYPGGW